jgi:cytochrome c-type biogenesis protein
MALLILSFAAGILTVAAPCILPLLPIIVGGSVVRDGQKPSLRRPLIIAGSLALSVVAFTLLLKASTSLLGVPQVVWQIVSGTIVTLFGLNLLFPEVWERLAAKLYIRSSRLLSGSFAKKGVLGDVLIGASLGPVFSSCSPTYALIVATVLPASFSRGLAYLLAYAIGLAAALLVIAYLGQALVQKLGWLSNPHGWFKKVVGIIFIAVGISVLFGWDKRVQSFVLERGWYDPISKLERSLDR